MRQIITICFLLSLTSLVSAQISWDNAKPDTVYSFETNPDVEVHNKITFSDSGTYRWVREFITTCPITSAICDKNTCYLEHVDSAIFVVGDNESFPFLIHFYPNDNCCKHAKILLRVYKVADPSVKSQAEYNISLWCSSASVEPKNIDFINIYPNPCVDLLTLDINSSNISNIQVHDQLGREMTIFASSNSNVINVESLKSGIYFLSFLSDGVLTRKTFVKQ